MYIYLSGPCINFSIMKRLSRRLCLSFSAFFFLVLFRFVGFRLFFRKGHVSNDRNDSSLLSSKMMDLRFREREREREREKKNLSLIKYARLTRFSSPPPFQFPIVNSLLFIYLFMFKEHKKEIKGERSGKKRRPSKNNEWIKDMTTMETSSLSRCRDGVSASQSPLLSSAAVAASSFNEPTPNEWIIPLCRKAVSDNDKRSCGNCITLQRNPYLLGLLTIEIGWGTVMNGSLQCSSLMRSWTELTVWVSFFLFSSFLVGLGFWGVFFFEGF